MSRINIILVDQTGTISAQTTASGLIGSVYIYIHVCSYDYACNYNRARSSPTSLFVCRYSTPRALSELVQKLGTRENGVNGCYCTWRNTPAHIDMHTHTHTQTHVFTRKKTYNVDARSETSAESRSRERAAGVLAFMYSTLRCTILFPRLRRGVSPIIGLFDLD